MQKFSCPTTVYTGSGALEALRSFAANRVLIVADPYFSENGTTELLRSLLDQAQVRIFDHVKPDPDAALAAQGAAVCREFGAELVVALGGGSALDCAKGVICALDQKLPLIAIPTTSGSGSEMTSYAVLTHQGVKIPVLDPDLRPAAAILDERFLQQMPGPLIAEAGMDILAHGLEALASTGRSGFTDALALHACQCVLEYLTDSFRGSVQVRQELHEAAAMAGLAFEQAGLGVCHGLVHALGGAFPVAHGRLCAMVLPRVLQVNEPAWPAYARLARRCGLGSATDRLAVRNLIAAVEKLRKSLCMPQTLAQAGITDDLWQAKKAGVLEAALRDPCCSTNPVPVTAYLLEQILNSVVK